MLCSGRFAWPVYDEEGGGGSVAVESESLADHEASFAPGVTRAAEPEPEPEPEPDDEPEPAPAAAAERDAQGKFKPRHRAKSQQASPEDVPRIQALTRQLREAEARAEAAERREPAPVQRQEPHPTPPAVAEKFPAFEVWSAQTENADKDYGDYVDARAESRYKALRAAERQEDSDRAAQTRQREAITAYREQLADVQATYTDYDTVVAAGADVSKVMEQAALEVGPLAAYLLAKDPERAAMTEETLIDPSNPAFPAAVAAMKRYLRALVASAQRSDSSSSRAAAVVTGAAPTSSPKLVPKPPTPVRTGAMKDADAVPGDDSSLADHERAFLPKRHRA